MKKKDYKHLIWQDWGIFDATTLVVVNYDDYKELLNELKGKKYTNWREAIKSKMGAEDCEKLQKNCHFSKWETKEKDWVTYTLLWLKDYDDTVDSHIILAHELVHAISYIVPDVLDPMKENECFARTHTYLMREIIRKIKLYRK